MHYEAKMKKKKEKEILGQMSEYIEIKINISAS